MRLKDIGVTPKYCTSFLDGVLLTIMLQYPECENEDIAKLAEEKYRGTEIHFSYKDALDRCNLLRRR